MYGKVFYFSKSIRMKRLVLKRFLNIIPIVYSAVRLFILVLIKLLLQNETYLMLYK